jgi:hypothetical protein
MNKDLLCCKLCLYGVTRHPCEKDCLSFSTVNPSKHKHEKLQRIYEWQDTGEEDKLLRSTETVFFGPDGA